jgi:hypothetical protein
MTGPTGRLFLAAAKKDRQRVTRNLALGQQRPICLNSHIVHLEPLSSIMGLVTGTATTESVKD